MWRKYVAKRHTVRKATIRKHWHTLNRNAFFVHSTNTIWWVIQYVLCVLSLKEYNIRIIVQFAFQWNCLLCTSSVSSWQSDVFPKLFITWCKLRRAQHKTLSEIMEMKKSYIQRKIHCQVIRVHYTRNDQIISFYRSEYPTRALCNYTDDVSCWYGVRRECD